MDKTTCEYCKYETVSGLEEPCSSCKHAYNIGSKEYEYGKEKFEPKAEQQNGEDLKTIRRQILEKAISCVCGQRIQDYGKPEDNFQVIADLWTAYTGHEFTSLDVTIMMALMKIGRIRTGTATEDSFADLAGYAACGAEIAARKEKEND